MSKTPHIIEIEIPGFDQHQIRKDLKKMHWFKVQTSFFQNVDLFGHGPHTKLVFLYVLSSVCERIDSVFSENDGKTKINVKKATQELEISKAKLFKAVASLEQIQWFRVISSTESVKPCTESVRTRSESGPREENRTEENRKREQRRGEESIKIPIRTDSDPPKSDSKSHWLTELWNEKRGILPRVLKPVSKKRLATIKRRIKENPDKETWSKCLDILIKSEFCTGSNDRGWLATFDWFIKPDILESILEGKYSKHSSKEETNKERCERLFKESNLNKERLVNP